MAVKTLLNRQEVIEYAEYSDTFPATAIKLIADVERDEFNRILGWDLYELMLSNVTNVSTATKYTIGTYNLNNIVIYDNKYYTCLRNGVTTQPPTLNDWKLTPKFQSECYNVLWCDYLARYLSLCVIQKHSPTALLTMAAGVLTQKISSDYNTPTKAAIDTQLRGIEELRQKALSNLDAFIKREAAKTDSTLKACYEKYKNYPNSTNDCGCGCEDPCSTTTTTAKTYSKWY